MLSKYIYKIKDIEEHELKADPKYGKFIEKLKGKKFIETKKDGNCFYSTLALLLHPLLKSKEFYEKFTSFSSIFQTINVDELVYECFLDDIKEVISTKEIENLGENDLDSFVAYLRLLCSAYAQSNSDKYQGYLDIDLTEHCRKNIDPLYQRADSFEMMVMADCLSLQIHVTSLFNSSMSTYDIGKGTKVSILHTPDHFQPLF